MNPKQERFCQEYAVDLNGAQAAIRAGYAPTHAKVTASRMLTYANVRERIDRAIARLLELRRGDQLHRLRDLRDVLHRLTTFENGAGFGHRSVPVPSLRVR